MSCRGQAQDWCGVKPSANSSRRQPGKEPEPLQKLLNLKFQVTTCSCVCLYKCWTKLCLVLLPFLLQADPSRWPHWRVVAAVGRGWASSAEGVWALTFSQKVRKPFPFPLSLLPFPWSLQTVYIDVIALRLDLPRLWVLVGCLASQIPFSVGLLQLSLTAGLLHSCKLLLRWLPLPHGFTRSLPPLLYRVGMTFSYTGFHRRHNQLP